MRPARPLAILAALLLAGPLLGGCANDGPATAEDAAARRAPYPVMLPFDQLIQPPPAGPDDESATAARIAALKARAAGLTAPILTDAERAALARK